MAALPKRYSVIYVGRILKKVEDGQEIKGLVRHFHLEYVDPKLAKGQKFRKTYAVYWEGEPQFKVLSLEEVQKYATNEFTTEEWLNPSIVERQKVGWDESKLDMEDLRMKVIFAKSMKNVYIARKASKEAARVETAVDGKLWEPAQPPLVPVYGQPVDKSSVPLVTPQKWFKAMKLPATKKGDPPNRKYKKIDPYEKALANWKPRPPVSPEVRAEGIRLIGRRVAYREAHNKAKQAVKKKQKWLEYALKLDSGEIAEPVNAGSLPNMKVQRRKKKLEPAKIQKQLEDAEKRVVEAKADFDREAAVVKEWEIEHGVVLPKPIPKSRLAAGVKPKAKGQPKTLNSATAPATDAAAAAEKPKGRATVTAGTKIAFGESAYRKAQKEQAAAATRRRAVEKRKQKLAEAAAAGAAAGAAADTSPADADAPGPSAAGSYGLMPPAAPGPSPAPGLAPAGTARKSNGAAAAASKSLSSAGAGTKAAAAAAKKPAPAKPKSPAKQSHNEMENQDPAQSQETQQQEKQKEKSLPSSILLDLSIESNSEATAAAAADAEMPDAGDIPGPFVSDVAAAAGNDDVQILDDAAQGEPVQIDDEETGDDEEEMRTYFDGKNSLRSYPARLCKRPGDMPLEEWSELEAQDKMPADAEYVVEAIMDERKKMGKREFLIKWKGYELHPHQWFPLETVDSCTVLDDWERDHPPMKSTPVRKRKRSYQD